MGTFLTFTLDEDGSLVHVDDVSKGMKCGCHCPHCDAPLYAKNAGQIREHHFAHAFRWIAHRRAAEHGAVFKNQRRCHLYSPLLLKIKNA